LNNRRGTLCADGKIAIQGRARHAKLFSDCADGDIARPQQCPDRLQILRRQFPRPTALATTRPGRFQAGHGSFANQVALELSERPEHMEHQLPGWGAGVDSFGEGRKGNAALLQVLGQPNEVAEAATQAVEPPDDGPSGTFV